jgi:hypothetical protein
MVNEDNFSPLAPPMPGEGFGNVETKKIRVHAVTGKPKNNKGLVQLNTKVKGKVRSRFELLYEAAASQADITKGDFVEMLLAKWEKTPNADLTKFAETLAQTPVPPARDKAAGRDRAVELFVTGDLAKALNRRGTKHGWTISETVEHACAMAKRAEGLSAELEQPCGHCGKQRKR